MGYQCIDTYQEVIVSSIEEIYLIIQKYKAFRNLPRPGFNDKGPYLDAFYRGQSNSEWDITPSLVRSNIEEEKLLETYAPKETMSLFGTIAYIHIIIKVHVS